MHQLSWNMGASVSWNPQGLSRPVMGLLYLFVPFIALILPDNLQNFQIYTIIFSLMQFGIEFTLQKHWLLLPQ
jgi:peptidoglycan/LPS O-acetylase OafA/YrhL